MAEAGRALVGQSRQVLPGAPDIIRDRAGRSSRTRSDRTGLDDLAAGAETAALLVSIGAPRLRQLGLDVADPIPGGEHRLYELLSRADPDSAHSRYNALIRRLVSFERALAATLRQE